MLQLASAEATLANGGIKHRPHLVLAIKDTVSGETEPSPQPPGENLGYAPKNVDLVRNALVAVNKGGTGTRVFAGAPYSSAGKTGTAQAVAWGQGKYNAKALEEHQRDHSLFSPSRRPTRRRSRSRSSSRTRASAPPAPRRSCAACSITGSPTSTRTRPTWPPSRSARPCAPMGKPRVGERDAAAWPGRAPRGADRCPARLALPSEPTWGGRHFKNAS